MSLMSYDDDMTDGNLHLFIITTESLSEKAKNFLMRCFDPEPSSRATAAQLLEDPFICSEVLGVSSSSYRYKKKASSSSISAETVSNMRLPPVDYSRSVSVPADVAVARGQNDNSYDNMSTSSDV